MTKNYILWTGIKANSKVSDKYKYGDYSWMEYSRKTWEFYAKKIGAEFIAYEKPFDDTVDLLKTKVNWLRWLELSKIIPDDYDQVLSTDASIMVRWDCPNLFDIANFEFTAVRGNENLRWTYESVMGYKDMFPDVQFRPNDYFASGFIIFSKKHKEFWKNVKEFYYENAFNIIRHEDETVKRGRDQPILNYLVRKHNIPIKYFPIAFGVNHLYRREILRGNWQLQQQEPTNNEHGIPFFIKYFYVYIFSGFSDRGETRTNMMKQTWEIIKHNYGST